MDPVHSSKLDPRLRRLVAIAEEPALRERAVARGEIQAMHDAPAHDGVSKRVLVELSSDGPPPNVPGVRWTRVVERIYSASVPLARLETLAGHTEVERIEAGRKWFQLLDSSASETGVASVHAPFVGERRTGEGVLIGIIDFGLDFTLDDFRDDTGRTRVAFLWDQSLRASANESAPAGFGYGVEYAAAAIDEALATPAPFERVRHRPAPASHGTHVASIATGNGRSADASFPAGRYVGAAPDATLIFVQPDSFGQGSSFTDSSNVADAVAYVFDKAREMGLPCVCNMSLGQNGGSHDGESVVERAIDRLLEPGGRTFVSAAGNEHVWRGHASGRLRGGEIRTLRWKIGGGMPVSGGTIGTGIDRTSNEIEIWYSSRDQFRISLVDPNGNRSTALAPGDGPLLERVGGASLLFADSERFTVFNGDARIYLELEGTRSQAVTAGTWTVEVEALEVRDGWFDAWIERDVRDPANDFADQSFFVGADFDPVGTLGTPATARRGLAVANYDHRLLAVADSSSRGPTRDARAKPELAAPGTSIVAAHALGGQPLPDGTGVYPMRVRKSGTSMAAPQVAGIAALLLEERPTLSAAQIRALLVAGADNPDGEVGFDTAWGFGRVSATRSLALLRGEEPQPLLPA